MLVNNKYSLASFKEFLKKEYGSDYEILYNSFLDKKTANINKETLLNILKPSDIIKEGLEYQTSFIKKGKQENATCFGKMIRAKRNGYICNYKDNNIYNVSKVIKVVRRSCQNNWLNLRELLLSKYLTSKSALSISNKQYDFPPFSHCYEGYLYSYETRPNSDISLILVIKKYNCDLMDLIETNKLSEYNMIDIFRKIYNITDYLHNLGIIHRDIKPENILIDTSICLCDFGSCVFFEESTRFPAGTLYYMSPEITNYLCDVDHTYTGELYSIAKTIMCCLGLTSYGAWIIPTAWDNGNEYMLYQGEVGKIQSNSRDYRIIKFNWHNVVEQRLFKSCIAFTNTVDYKFFEPLGIKSTEINLPSNKTDNFKWITRYFFNEKEIQNLRLEKWNNIKNILSK